MNSMIVRYRQARHVFWGKLLGQAPTSGTDVLDVAPLVANAATTGELIASLIDVPHLAVGDPVTIKASQLLSPITEDATLICQGLNYISHQAESGYTERKQNLLFSKAASSLSGPYDDIVKPAAVELLDYEVEIGIVLRAPITAGTRVTEQNVADFVAGVVLCNDVSARDVMFGASFMQWFQGKSYRTFCPAGPLFYLVDPAEVVETLQSIEIALSLNGEERQRAQSSQMIFGPVETLNDIAAIMDLKRGDLILSGTPGGVIVQGTPALIEILKTRLHADTIRRDEMRVEQQARARFLEQGDVLTLRMRDVRSGLELGQQRCVITDA
jgi:2-keto-4-pentenoate hydratase/2-oxohepta-3-ene-1,7-dioic acid hydratase in catechol pathway